MSGDVQPRKRKDKKRKKEDSTEQIPAQLFQTPLSTTPVDDNITIHVHKEDGTGGGICAKIVFFLLFSALAVLIGLIITEHRGLTNLDTVETESRFSHLFEGWIDQSHGEHEHDDAEHLVDSLEHDSHEEEEQDEEPLSEEHNPVDDDDDDDDIDPAESGEDDQTVESEEADGESEPNEDPSDESQEVEAEEDNDDGDEEENQSVDQSTEEIAEEEHQSDEEIDDDIVASEEAVAESQENASEHSEEKDQEDAAAESEEHDEEVPAKDEVGKEAPSEDQTSRMVVKIGVGVALLVVAHVVLVRKWKSATPAAPAPAQAKEATPDLSRRNTLVVPPTFQEVEQDIEEVNNDEEYSDEDGEVDSEEDRVVNTPKSKYQELRTTYTRSLTPESEPEARRNEEEYEEEDGEEEEDEIEEESDYEKDEDDEELLKRLEAKYGRLQSDEKVDDDEQFASWKRVKVLGDDEAEESESDGPSDLDADAYEYENITNRGDWTIKEKLDDAQKAVKHE